jgi:hypothetical protein
MKLAFEKAAAAQLARKMESPRRDNQKKDGAQPRGPSPLLLLAGAAALAVAGFVATRRPRQPVETPEDSSGACDHEGSVLEALAPAVPDASVPEAPLLEHAHPGSSSQETAELAALRAEHERLIREATAALLNLRQGAQEEDDGSSVSEAELDLSWARDAVQTAEQALAQVVAKQAEVRTERAAINAVGMQADADWVAAVNNARALLDEELEHLAQLLALRLDELQFCKARAAGAQAAFERRRQAVAAASLAQAAAAGAGHLEVAADGVQPHGSDVAAVPCGESPAHAEDIAAAVDAALDDIMSAVCAPGEGRSVCHIPPMNLWDIDAVTPRHQPLPPEAGPNEAPHLADNTASLDVLAEASAVSRALESPTDVPALNQPPLPRFKLKSSLPVLTTVFTPSSARRPSSGASAADKVQPVEARMLVVPPPPPLLADARTAMLAPVAAARPSATLPLKRAAPSPDAPAASSEAGPSRVATRLGVAAIPKRGPGSPRKGRRVALRTEKTRPADAQVVVPLQQRPASQQADSMADESTAAAAAPPEPVAADRVAAVADAGDSVTASAPPVQQLDGAPLPAPAPSQVVRQLSEEDMETAPSTGAKPREVATTSAAQELRSASRALLAPTRAGTPMATSTPGATAAAQQLLAAAQQLNQSSSSAVVSTASPSAASAADELRAMSRRLLSPSLGKLQSPQVASAAGDLLRAATASRGEQAVQAAPHPPEAEPSEAQSVAGSQKAEAPVHVQAAQQKRAHEDAKRRAEREAARKQVEQQRAEERAKARAAAEESRKALEAAKRRRVEEAAAKARAVAEGQRLAADAAKALAERQRAEATAAKQRAIAEERKRAEEAALRKAEDDRLAAEAAVARAAAEHQRVAIEAAKKLRADEAAAKTRREAEEQRRAAEEARKQAESAAAEAAAVKARALALEQRRAKEAQAERERAEAAAAKLRAMAEEERKAQLAAAKLAELDAKARALAEERELVTGRKRPVASRQQALKKEVVKAVRDGLDAVPPAVAVVIATERATQPLARASQPKPVAAAGAVAAAVAMKPVERQPEVPPRRKPRKDDDEEPETDWYLR